MTKDSDYTLEPVAEDPDSYWSTPDLQMASTLVTAGFPVFYLQENEQDQTYFIFERTAELEEAADKYWRDELSLNPRRLFSEYRDLKTRLHS